MMERTEFRVIELEQNQGTGNALRVAMEHCTYPLVAHMDSDDISAPNRFALQLAFLESHPQVDAVGSNITEFVGEETHITWRRTVPETDAEIKAYLKKRCPMNHMTVMYKKEAVLAAGNYRSWPGNEDYNLWIRMAQTGCVFANLPENLVNARVGEGMTARRGGMAYFQSERKIQECLHRSGLISYPRYLYNVALRFGGEVLVADRFRSKLFRLMREPYRSDPTERKMEQIENTGIVREFSVNLATYGGDRPEWLDRALASISLEQTVQPREIVLVVDGPISEELRAVIRKYEELCRD